MRPQQTLNTPPRLALSPVVLGVNIVLHLFLVTAAALAWATGNLHGAFSFGLILTAYTLGLRHAFDPDHIAAIDNTTRALQTHERTPQSIGMFFALGHSTVVILAAGLVALSAQWAGLTEDSPVTEALGIWGAAFSGVTLLLLAVINLLTLRSLYRQMRQSRPLGDGAPASAEPGREGYVPDGSLPRGPLTRLLGPALRKVTRPWHMYPVGFLFGLGFDTATEISLLILAAGGVAAGAPWWVTMLLPLSFTAGMALLDSIDGVFMAHAYRWALHRPHLKLRYNITMTAVSVLFAVLIGGTGLMSLAAELGLPGFAWVEGVNLDYAGFVVLGLFVTIFATALALWRRRPQMS
ncbi:HoxN/HupN/NixA family nickel/cobalt transporter [Corynebacterium heidelbergense]|uniref:Nickel/cobalt efflux system n=1 Tax=Corynebacterium heidelbergense TaxID=2055947 RepID=A0A364V462_9CORY|nr:HoxN/HupN/NixA family nickel/cobalt transporter [Corynebacterium heidelbergense]RAV31422.1 HoxN/HupN/NixA family nickel/cobalt transporter [Corynebacterium heidelbergense]